jgi:NADH dehydrogenase FAD-containing subunit
VTAASNRLRVLILGGGFAGLRCAQSLSADRYAVTLVDRSAWFEFLPNIHELISGVKTPDLLRIGLASSMQRSGHRFLRDTVNAIDPAARTVRTRRRRKLTYDLLLIALGGIDSTDAVPGAAEHALPFKSVDDCVRIGKRLARLATRRKPARVVVIGSGLEGVEALGEILRAYRSTSLHTTLLEARPRLLPEAPSAVARHLRHLCERYPVDFLARSAATAITAKSVKLRGGAALPADLTIWTGGPAPSPLLADSGLAPRGAWVPVSASLQVAEYPEIHVAGNAAALPEPISKQAYHALDMGVHVARNIERVSRGHAPVAFRPSGKPMLVSFGDISCFVIAGERVLAGASLSAGKEAVYELTMAQLDNRPMPTRMLRAVQRGETAARTLLMPRLASFSALRRQPRLQWLA